MFPIGDDQHHKGRFAPVTRLFLAINIIVFLHQASLSPAGFEMFVRTWGTVPELIMSGQNLISLLTNMFLHGSWMHLIGNMLFLYVFGDNIEKELGSLKYILYYILGGVVASMTHIVLDPASSIPAVGASGAIAALLGSYLIWFPGAKIKMLIPQYGMRVMHRSAKQFLGYWIVFQLISVVGSFGGQGGGGVAWWAHIGGFAYGVVIALMTRKSIYQSSDNAEREHAVSQTSSPTRGRGSWFEVDKRVK